MKDIFAHQDLTVVGLHKSTLERAGIECFIRNENSAAALGAIPGFGLLPVFQPVLCIVDDSRLEEALTLISKSTSPPPLPGTDWPCAQCGELVPANFDSCWNCGGGRPAEPAAAKAP